MPEWSQINSIDASPHDAGTAYVAATMYKSDDFRPYLYKTSDYGKTWKKIVNGIPDDALHARGARRSQPQGPAGGRHRIRPLHFLSTMARTGSRSKLNMPVTPITDVAFHKREQDLVVATQGRSFYVLDDVPLLYQLNDSGHRPKTPTCSSPRTLTASAAADAVAAAEDAAARPWAKIPAGGAVVYYWLKNRPQGEVTLEFLDGAGKLGQEVFQQARRPPPAGACR